MESLKEEELLSKFTSEEIIEKIKSDKKWINKLKHSPTFAANILRKTSRNANKSYSKDVIDIIFNCPVNLKQMNHLYSLSMAGGHEKLLEKLLKNKLNIYEKINDSYILFGFIVRHRFEMLNVLFEHQLKTDKNIRWDMKSSSDRSLSSSICESLFYKPEQIEIIKKMQKDNDKNHIEETGITNKIFKSMIKETLLKKNFRKTSSISNFLKDMDTYCLLMPVMSEKSNQFYFLSNDEKNKIIKKIFVDFFIENCFLLNNDEKSQFILYINSKPYDVCKEEIVYDSVTNKIDLEDFNAINQIVDITDEIIKEVDKIKHKDLKEYLLKLRDIKIEKNLLSEIIKENPSEVSNKKRL